MCKGILNNKKTFGHILAAFTILVWGTTFVATKILLVEFSPMEILFFRFLIGYLILLAVKPKFIKPVSFKQEGLFILASISGVSLYQYLENLSLEYTSASNVSIIIACSTFFIAIFSKIFFKDKSITRYFFYGFIISIIGVGLVSYNGTETTGFFPKGDLIALFAAVLWGVYSVVVKLIEKYDYSSLLVTRRILFYGTVILIPFCIFGKQDLTLSRFSNLENLMLMLFLGVVASAICFFTWNLAVKYIGAVSTGLYIYFNPVVTIIFGIIILNEKLTLMGVVGTILIICGLFLSTYKKQE